jgi:hypothetical protein
VRHAAVTSKSTTADAFTVIARTARTLPSMVGAGFVGGRRLRPGVVGERLDRAGVVGAVAARRADRQAQRRLVDGERAEARTWKRRNAWQIGEVSAWKLVAVPNLLVGSRR